MSDQPSPKPPCPICKGSGIERMVRITTDSGEVMRMLECMGCGGKGVVIDNNAPQGA